MNYDKAIGLYKEWNAKINVISRKDIDNIYEHHILHSLALAEYMRRFHSGAWNAPCDVLDAGTGGGFPGIPLAMEFPSASFTLCDSIGKKIKVAEAVAEGLALRNVRVVNARVESLPDKYDWVVSRAVARLPEFYDLVKGKYRSGIICLKGGDIEEEISDLMRESGLERSRIRSWRISEWLKDDYFTEKFVIEIGKDYLCPPKTE